MSTFALSNNIVFKLKVFYMIFLVGVSLNVVVAVVLFCMFNFKCICELNIQYCFIVAEKIQLETQ